jgi:hypothetical protein
MNNNILEKELFFCQSRVCFCFLFIPNWLVYGVCSFTLFPLKIQFALKCDNDSSLLRFCMQKEITC